MVVNLRNNFLIFSDKMLNILIFVCGISETCKRNNCTFWVIEVCSGWSMALEKFQKIQYNFRKFKIPFLKNIINIVKCWVTFLTEKCCKFSNDSNSVYNICFWQKCFTFNRIFFSVKLKPYTLLEIIGKLWKILF